MIIGTLLAGLFISLGVWYLAMMSESRQAKVRFDREVQQTAANIRDQVADYDEVLFGLRGSVVIEPDLTREQFHFAVEGGAALQRMPGIHSLQWVIPVAKNQGAEFEQRSSSETVPDMEPVEVTIHPAMSDPVNYVVDYVEPLAYNRYAVGLNLSGLPGRAEFIRAARDTGELVASVPVSLVLEDDEKPGFVVYLPVYDQSEVPATRAQRRASFRGIVAGVFVAENLLAGVKPEGRIEGFAVYDTGSVKAGADQATGQPQVLYASQDGLDPAAAEATVQVTNGDRRWNVYFFADSATGSPLPWLLLISGLALTGISALYVYTSARARVRAESNAKRLAESERKFVELSMIDPLTGLANRRLLMATLEQMRSVAQRTDDSLALMYLDVDSFKSVNDVHGHGAGDDLLVEVARRLSEVARPQDVVGRLSGDEFCIGGLVSSRDEAMSNVAAVNEVLHAPYELRTGVLPVRVSAGVVVVRDPQQGIEELLDSADSAMYEAKSRGGGEVVWFDDQLASRAAAELRCAGWLRGAIDDGAFTLHYQPILSLETGETVAAEALLRLTPDEGILMPGDFLPCAERSNLIRPLGLEVIRRVVAQRADWQRLHPDSTLTVAVNLSASQAADPDTLAVFQESLEQWQLPPSLFSLELTETAIFGSSLDSRAFIEKAREMGVSLCIDDFGVGYSNLQALSRLETQILKIDRSLIQQLPQDDKTREIVGSLAGMSPQLGVRLVAEGIETPEQLEAVRDLGIPLVQGFLLARPQESLAAAVQTRIGDRFATPVRRG